MANVKASGYLTYTVTITNNAENPFETPKITDTLDPTLITLVDNSVKIGDADAEYISPLYNGLLSISPVLVNVGDVNVYSVFFILCPKLLYFLYFRKFYNFFLLIFYVY